MSLKEYVSIICALTDIPVFKSRVESLHVLFSLYLEFKNSQHFRSRQADGDPGAEPTDGVEAMRFD